MYKFLLSIVVFCLSAQAVADGAADRINGVLDASGFNKLLARMPDFAQAVLKQSSGALEPEVNSALSAAFSSAFDVERVRRDVVGVMRSNYEQNHTETYLALLETPLAQQMMTLERAVSDSAHHDAFRRFVSDLVQHPPEARRSALVTQLDDANLASQFSIDMQTALFRAVFTAIEPVLDDGLRLESGELDRMVDEVRESLRDSTFERTRNAYLFAFRDIDDQQLQAYVELCQSAAYRQVVQVLGNAMVASINHAGARAASAMAHSLE